MQDLTPSLDPENWDDFRATAHRLLDACIDHLAKAEAHPWQPVPEAIREGYAIGPAEVIAPVGQTSRQFEQAACSARLWAHRLGSNLT